MGARSAGGGAPRCGEERTDGANAKIKASADVKRIRATKAADITTHLSRTGPGAPPEQRVQGPE